MKSRSFYLSAISVLVLLTMISLSSAQVPPPPVNPENNGLIQVNPHGGISAPSSTGGMIEPQVVQGPRGWGDAQFWFDPWTDRVKAEAVTWLNGTVKYKHTICANVIAFEIGGVNQNPDQIPACRSSVTGGASVWDSKEVWWSCNGSPLFGMRSHHTISSTSGSYFWGPAEDFEITYSCQ